MGILALIVLFALSVLLLVAIIVLARGPSRRRPAPELPELPTVLFHPSKQEGKEPEGFEVVETPVDGAVIKSHLFRNSDAGEDDVVVFFHGNGEIAADWFEFAPKFASAFKANLLLVDYRGYGLSTGGPTYRNLLSDAEAVFKAVGARFKGSIHVFGRSIGSAAAIHVAWTYKDNVASLVVDSGFAHLPALIERLGRGSVPSPKLPEDFLDNVDKLKNIRIPTLFLHGVEDKLIPIEAARENHGASTAYFKDLVEIEGAGHNSTILSRDYFSKVADFQEKYRCSKCGRPQGRERHRQGRQRHIPEPGLEVRGRQVG